MSGASEPSTTAETKTLMIRCWVCHERKPMGTAEVVKTAGGCGRAWRCKECSR